MFKALRRWLAKSFADGPSMWTARDWTRALRGDAPGIVTLESIARNGTVICCAGALSDSLAACELALVQRLPGGGVAPVLQHDAVNALATLEVADRASSAYDLLSRGNGWLLYENGTLFALDASRLLVTIDPAKQVWLRQMGIDRYIAADETAHFMWRKQPGFYLAWHPLQMASDSVSTSLAITAMGKALALNAQHPGGVLESPIALTSKSIENLRSSWAEAVGGEKQGSIAVLEQGVKYNGDLGLPSAADSEMTAALNWSVSSIAAFFGVPNSILNLTESVNKSLANEEAKLFARSLRPHASRIEDALTRKLLTPEDRARGLRIEHDLQSYAIGSGLEQAQYWKELVNAGIATSNEGRNAVGLADQPLADELRVPSNTIWISRLADIPKGAPHGGSEVQ